MNPIGPSQWESPSGSPPNSCDQNWIREIFEKYHSGLMAYSIRFTHGDFELARDCVQEVFVRLCQEERYAIQGHIEAWLYRCCRHRILDRIRKESKMVVQFASHQLEGINPPTSTSSDPIVLAETIAILHQHLEALPRKEQEVLVLRLQQGLSYKQIAEVLELSVSHVGVLIHQAILKLRDSLKSD